MLPRTKSTFTQIPVFRLFLVLIKHMKYKKQKQKIKELAEIFDGG